MKTNERNERFKECGSGGWECVCISIAICHHTMQWPPQPSWLFTIQKNRPRRHIALEKLKVGFPTSASFK